LVFLKKASKGFLDKGIFFYWAFFIMVLYSNSMCEVVVSGPMLVAVEINWGSFSKTLILDIVGILNFSLVVVERKGREIDRERKRCYMSE
jgi:hypothetical protein